MSRVRVGRRNGHTLYLQTGDDPADDDLFIGSCTTVVAARWLADAANCGIGHHPHLLAELTSDLLNATAEAAAAATAHLTAPAAAAATAEQ